MLFKGINEEEQKKHIKKATKVCFSAFEKN
jgi:hypothetical protein